MHAFTILNFKDAKIVCFLWVSRQDWKLQKINPNLGLFIHQNIVDVDSHDDLEDSKIHLKVIFGKLNDFPKFSFCKKTTTLNRKTSNYYLLKIPEISVSVMSKLFPPPSPTKEGKLSTNIVWFLYKLTKIQREFWLRAERRGHWGYWVGSMGELVHLPCETGSSLNVQ